VETSSLTERQTTGVPSWRRLNALPRVAHANRGDSRARGVHQGPFGLMVFNLYSGLCCAGAGQEGQDLADGAFLAGEFR
jgi:hypothetical protein